MEDHAAFIHSFIHLLSTGVLCLFNAASHLVGHRAWFG